MAASEAAYVTLALGDEVFAVSVAFVREILDYQAPFAIPEGPSYLLGLTDVRGRGTPTLDLTNGGPDAQDADFRDYA